MSANTAPIFTKTPNFGGIGTSALTAANTAKDGTGTVNTVHTAGSNGSYVRSLRAKSVGTNVLSLMRVFINNGSANSSATNNILYTEATLPAITNSETAAQVDIDIPLNLPLNAGYKIMVCLATAVASGWIISSVGGDY